MPAPSLREGSTDDSARLRVGKKRRRVRPVPAPELPGRRELIVALLAEGVQSLLDRRQCRGGYRRAVSHSLRRRTLRILCERMCGSRLTVNPPLAALRFASTMGSRAVDRVAGASGRRVHGLPSGRFFESSGGSAAGARLRAAGGANGRSGVHLRRLPLHR